MGSLVPLGSDNSAPAASSLGPISAPALRHDWGTSPFYRTTCWFMVLTTLCSSDLMSQRHKYSRNLGETRAYQQVGRGPHKRRGSASSVKRPVLQLSGVRSDISAERKYQLLDQTVPTTKQAA